MPERPFDRMTVGEVIAKPNPKFRPASSTFLHLPKGVGEGAAILAVRSLAAQRRQADPGGIEAAVDGWREISGV
jgi:hypothetical protein